MIFGKHINKYYLKYGLLLLLGIAALTLVDVAQLKLPEIYRMVVNGINDGAVEVDGALFTFDLDFLLDRICFPLIIIILIMVSGRFLWRIGFFGSAVRVQTDMREEMFDHCKELSQQYYQVNKVGDLMSLFTNDIETIQDCFGNGVLMFSDALLLGVLSLIKMVRMNWLLAVFSMIPLLFLFVGGLTVGRYMTDKWEERQEAFSKLSDFSQESFSGIHVIKAFAKETKELMAFRKLNKLNEKVNVEFVKLSTLLNVAITFFVESMVCVILGYGGYLVYIGTFSAGEMVEFIGYFTAIVWPVLAVSMLIDMHARGKASLKRVSKLLDTQVDVKDGPDVEQKKHDIRGGIEFRSLSFTYPGSEVEVLHSVSFTIKAGENVGIIGKTGTGKTTVVDLIARTYNVPDGTIFVDGTDVNRIPIRELRDHIAYVPQDNFLFSERIMDNIAFSVEGEIPEERVREAARLADVDENILEFPDQYETVLGERGVTVSGGQKQRISIARALMKNAEILILDDSVSAVDTKTEKNILGSLKKTRAGKTTLLIAHRISTIKEMDKIILIDDGSVAAVGSHEELMEQSGLYREMVELQKLEDSGEERE